MTQSRKAIAAPKLLHGLVFASLLLLAASTSAQSTGGSLAGVVRDKQSAIIPNAEVVAINTDTKVSRKEQASSSGAYRFTNLLPGHYQLKATAVGFSTLVISDVTINVGDAEEVDLEMPVGAVTEVVQVTASDAGIELVSTDIVGTVTANAVRELPLNGRDWTQLSLLQPGVTQVLQSASGISNQRANRGLGSQLAIGGNRPQGNNYRLDGISINDYSNGGPGSVAGVVLGVDAVKEFSVITNNPSASYGRTTGGVINAITRSGTSQLHGSGFEFARNSTFDARNYFDPVGGTPPPLTRHQFGGSIGGPILKEKLFFFGAYEGLRQTRSVTQTLNVPTTLARTGALKAGSVTVDPAVVPYLAFYPVVQGTSTTDTLPYISTAAQVTREDFATGRIDAALTSKDNLFGTYFLDDGNTQAPDSFNVVQTAVYSRRQGIILEETHTVSANLVNTARIGYSRVASVAPKTIGALVPSAADPTLGFEPGRNVGLINVGGLGNFAGGVGAVGEYDFHFGSFQGYNDLVFNRGQHSMTMGVAVERILDNQRGAANPNGQFIFGSLKSFLLNQPTSFNGLLGTAPVTPRDVRETIFGVFFQDSWRVRNNVTLNLGIRYEMATVPTETAGRLSNLPTPSSPTPKLGGSYFKNPTLKNFEPRVGFAWDPFGDGKTSVRSAFGIFDVLPLPYLFELDTILAAPYYQSVNISQSSTVKLAGTFPNKAYSLLTPANLRYSYVDPTPPRSYVMQWNASIQRELLPSLTLLIDYVGSRGVHLPYYGDDINYVQPTQVGNSYYWPLPKGSGSRPNPNAGQVSATGWNADSIHHALEVGVTKEMRHGFQLGGAYTWAKTLDTGSVSIAADTFPNSVRRLFFSPKSARGPADFDLRNVVAINSIWELPKAKLPAAAGVFVNGWQMNGIYRASSGQPFTPGIAGDPLGQNSAITFDFPDRVPAPNCDNPVDRSNPAQYIRRNCFVFPAATPLGLRLGNVGRNSLLGPALSQFDLSLFKNTDLHLVKETFHVQLRFEAFNVLNHTNFAPPITNRNIFDASGNPTGGGLNITATDSRQLQFGIKAGW